MFLGREARRRQIESPPMPREPLSRDEKTTLLVAAAMVVLWVTHEWHGLEIATTSFLGAFLLMLPGAGVLNWKAGLKAVTWNLIFFVGAALVLGEALIDTGAAQILIGLIFSLSGLAQAGSQLMLLCGLALLTLTSHLTAC